MEPAKPSINESKASVPKSAPQRKLSHRILSGGAWSLAGRIGSIGSLFLLTTLLVNKLPKSQSSAYMTAGSVIPLMAMLATLGTPVTLLRVLRAETTDARRRREALGGALKVTAAGALLIAGVFWLASIWFPPGDQWQVLRNYPAYVATWVSFSALCMVAANYLQAQDDFRTASLVGARSGGLIPNGLALGGAAGFAALGALTLGAVLMTQVVAYAISLVFAAWFIRRTLDSPALHDAPIGEPPAVRLTPRWYLHESWPNLINQVIGVIFAEVDLFWVAVLSNDDVVADYGAIRNLRMLVWAPLMVASIALPPFVAELYGRRDMVRLERLIRASATALALPSLMALIIMLAAPTTVIRLVYGEAFVSAALALQILSLGAIVFVLTGNNAMVLTMTGHHRELMICSLGSLALYVAISAPLVTRYGVTGAATAFTIQLIIQNLAITLVAKRKVGIWTVPFTSWSAARSEVGGLLRQFRSRV